MARATTPASVEDREESNSATAVSVRNVERLSNSEQLNCRSCGKGRVGPPGRQKRTQTSASLTEDGTSFAALLASLAMLTRCVTGMGPLDCLREKEVGGCYSCRRELPPSA